MIRILQKSLSYINEPNARDRPVSLHNYGVNLY